MNIKRKMEIKIIPMIISALLLIIFLVPFFKGIFCLGNCVGTVISAALLTICIFRTRFITLLGRLWAHTPGRIVLVILALLLTFAAALAIVISIFMIRAADSPPPDTNTTVVVLGCQVKGTEPSLMLRRRLDAAYDYLTEHEDVAVIVSGGQGSDELVSEARCMQEYLIGRGISADRIYVEDKSTDTYENLKFSREIIEAEGLPEAVTLITDGYHQLRSQMTAQRLGISTYGISCYTSWWLVPTYWLRELFAVSYYAVFQV